LLYKFFSCAQLFLRPKIGEIHVSLRPTEFYVRQIPFPFPITYSLIFLLRMLGTLRRKQNVHNWHSRGNQLPWARRERHDVLTSKHSYFCTFLERSHLMPRCFLDTRIVEANQIGSFVRHLRRRFVILSLHVVFLLDVGAMNETYF
jgi:hypothetical protein